MVNRLTSENLMFIDKDCTFIYCRRIPCLITNKYGYVYVWIRSEDSLGLSTKVLFDMSMERLNSDV